MTTALSRHPVAAPTEVDRRLLARLVRWTAFASMWAWGGITLVAWGVTRSNLGTMGITESVIGSMSMTPRNFIIGFAITLAVGWFLPHVATGGTRRSYVSTTTVAVVLMAAAYAVLLAAAFRIEAALYAANGWPAVINTGHLFTSGEQVGLVLAESFTLNLALGLGGVAIGSGYRRWGGWGGTYALAVTALPVLAATAVIELRASSGLGEALGVTGLDAPATFAVLAVLALASLAMAFRLAHGAPARPVGAIR